MHREVHFEKECIGMGLTYEGCRNILDADRKCVIILPLHNWHCLVFVNSLPAHKYLVMSKSMCAAVVGLLSQIPPFWLLVENLSL